MLLSILYKEYVVLDCSTYQYIPRIGHPRVPVSSHDVGRRILIVWCSTRILLDIITKNNQDYCDWSLQQSKQ